MAMHYCHSLLSFAVVEFNEYNASHGLVVQNEADACCKVINNNNLTTSSSLHSSGTFPRIR